MARRICIFLLQLGGPETLADIEPFLRNLFADVLPVPRLVRGGLARLIAWRRAPRVAPLYAELGGGSPLRRNTEAQAQALAARLATLNISARVLVGMRYAPPRVEAALAEARQAWADAPWVALPLYPQYSFATTRSSLAEIQALLEPHERLHVIESYPADPGYLDAVAARVREALLTLSSPRAGHLLFSAHGLPLRTVKAGDPYPHQVAASVAGVMERLHDSPPHSIAYQSRVGPVRWLTPETMATVRELARRGIKELVVVPISFVSEHIETLHELDIQLKAVARQAGIRHFVRVPAPGVDPIFIDALARLVSDATTT